MFLGGKAEVLPLLLLPFGFCVGETKMYSHHGRTSCSMHQKDVLVAFWNGNGHDVQCCQFLINTHLHLLKEPLLIHSEACCFGLCMCIGEKAVIVHQAQLNPQRKHGHFEEYNFLICLQLVNCSALSISMCRVFGQDVVLSACLGVPCPIIHLSKA